MWRAALLRKPCTGSTDPVHTADQACLKLAATQHWVITREEVLQLGLSATAVGRRLSSGLFVALYPGVYRVGAAPETWPQRLLGACLWADGVASHRSSLSLLGLEGYSGRIIEITTTATRRTSIGSVRIHHSDNLAPFELTTVDSIPTTNPTRTLLDVGSVLSQKGLEEALDSALRQRLTSLDRLRAGVERLGGRGSRGPGALGKLLDARGDVVPTDSALETRLSRLLRRHHLPQPERQVMASQQPAQPCLQSTVGGDDVAPGVEQLAQCARPPAAASAESLYSRPQPVQRCQALSQGGIERLLEALLRQDGTNIEQRARRVRRGNRIDCRQLERSEVVRVVDADRPDGSASRGRRRDFDDSPGVALESKKGQRASMGRNAVSPQTSA